MIAVKNGWLVRISIKIFQYCWVYGLQNVGVERSWNFSIQDILFSTFFNDQWSVFLSAFWPLRCTSTQCSHVDILSVVSDGFEVNSRFAQSLKNRSKAWCEKVHTVRTHTHTDVLFRFWRLQQFESLKLAVGKTLSLAAYLPCLRFLRKSCRKNIHDIHQELWF